MSSFRSSSLLLLSSFSEEVGALFDLSCELPCSSFESAPVPSPLLEMGPEDAIEGRKFFALVRASSIGYSHIRSVSEEAFSMMGSFCSVPK